MRDTLPDMVDDPSKRWHVEMRKLMCIATHVGSDNRTEDPTSQGGGADEEHRPNEPALGTRSGTEEVEGPSPRERPKPWNTTWCEAVTYEVG
jgi:hypothetical protein